MTMSKPDDPLNPLKHMPSCNGQMEIGHAYPVPFATDLSALDVKIISVSRGLTLIPAVRGNRGGLPILRLWEPWPRAGRPHPRKDPPLGERSPTALTKEVSR